ncbi:hypothetical protein K7X08_023693 [Anisodus acutangulus]|uniref:Uncharacterized protein n=1 Tax=Anisodus acutangulus TaxID=402998 RepID=A0A9Q1LA56_9SOLA|nr:hypothetical protein K7X08_023693 [Anisodus acutangulus]
MSFCRFFTKMLAKYWVNNAAAFYDLYEPIVGLSAAFGSVLPTDTKTFRLAAVSTQPANGCSASSTKVATVLLCCAFVYDIFWAFLSPLIFHDSVMISVAKGNKAGAESILMLLRTEGCTEWILPLADDWLCDRSLLYLLDHVFDGRTWSTRSPVSRAMHTRTCVVLGAVRRELNDLWNNSDESKQMAKVVGKDEFSRRFETSPSIWKMQKLRHVDIQVFSFKWEDNDRAVFQESSETVLGNLKTFGKCRICLADMAPEFWRIFPNIEQLNLHFVEPGYEVDMPNLEELPLQSLEVGFSRPILGYNPIGRDSCAVFPSNLKDLSLVRLCVTEKVVSQLAGLQNLERLKLQWRSSEASFPVLEKLIISNCRILCGQIPSSFVDIPTLKLIILICCDDSLEDSALNIKKEVEEMTGCDSLQVHMLYKTYEAADVSFAIDSFGAWDQEDVRNTLPLYGLRYRSSYEHFDD